MTLSPEELLLRYHQQTKHDFNRFARSLGYLDWESQPDPFRRFEGAERVALPRLPVAPQPTYAATFQPGAVAPEPPGIDAISRLLRGSLGLTAWKRHGRTRWGLRANPSSGNLHPTEGYLVTAGLAGLEPGLYHYGPLDHALERRATPPRAALEALLAPFPPGSFLVALTTIPWRETWKYGERAFRYCQHDAGHALGALRVAAAVLGWQLEMLDDLDDDELGSLLGLDRPRDFVAEEPEHPELLAVVSPGPVGMATVSPAAMAAVAAGPWHGRATPLSGDHVEWPIIDAAALLSRKPRTAARPVDPGPLLPQPPARPGAARDDGVPGEQLLQQRRSAVAFDGTTGTSRASFLRMLAATLAGPERIPFDAVSRTVIGRPRVHFAVFVHRVEGVEPGLYLWVRHPDDLATLRAAMHRTFAWEPVEPGHPLYLLERGDVRGLAERLSCDQEIASQGAFSLGMLACFGEPIRAHGAWLYRRLFWESGLIGQVLYLEAEAAGLRATGIGCYYDDRVHEVLGLEGDAFQSLYHFTIGGPVEDTRLTTEPGYSPADTAPDQV